MFSMRASGIAACGAFILSLIVGIVNGASMPMLILRPVIFAVIFFILAGVFHIIINRFLPELLEDSRDDSDFLPGSRINILEGDSADTSQEYQAAVPGKPFMGAQPDDSEDGLGDVSDLLKKGGLSVLSDEGTRSGMDQNEEDEYTKIRELGDSPKPEAAGGLGGNAFKEVPPRSVDSSTPGEPDMVDMLPDLESMAGAFLPASVGGGTDTTDGSVSGPSLKKAPSGGKAASWAGDFNAKDMAAGLRTILSKEKEG